MKAKSSKELLEKDVGKIEFLYITETVLFLILAALAGLNPSLIQYVVMTTLVILAIGSVILAYEWVNLESKL